MTDKVYTIEGNHLKELKPEEKMVTMEFIMEGNFSFQYAVIRGENFMYTM